MDYRPVNGRCGDGSDRADIPITVAQEDPLCIPYTISVGLFQIVMSAWSVPKYREST